jgi:hypothetical protein
MAQRTGMAATISIIAAIVSFFVVFSGHPFWGLLMAIGAVLLGVIGMIMAASARVRGGMISIAGIILGIIGSSVAILGIVGVILF